MTGYRPILEAGCLWRLGAEPSTCCGSAREVPLADEWDADPSSGVGAGQRIGDERLPMLFGCCHPALWEARLALTLRAVVGMTTQQIASAFLVPEATMAQRLVRAKRKITNAGIPSPSRKQLILLRGWMMC